LSVEALVSCCCSGIDLCCGLSSVTVSYSGGLRADISCADGLGWALSFGSYFASPISAKIAPKYFIQAPSWCGYLTANFPNPETEGFVSCATGSTAGAPRTSFIRLEPRDTPNGFRWIATIRHTWSVFGGTIPDVDLRIVQVSTDFAECPIGLAFDYEPAAGHGLFSINGIELDPQRLTLAGSIAVA
jgi:hypothetical protein